MSDYLRYIGNLVVQMAGKVNGTIIINKCNNSFYSLYF